MLLNPWFWPRWWRLSVLLNLSFYVLLENAWCSGLSPVFYLIIQEFHCTDSEASQLNTFPLLMLGMSNIFTLPLATLVGKRYTFLFAISVFLVFNIWSGEASTFQELRTSRILGGLAGGMIEGLGPTLVGETFPNDQLARAMVMYVGCLAAGSAVGPLVAGAIGEGLGDWRWFPRILSVAIGINLLGSLLMLPETSHKGTQEHETTSLEQNSGESKMDDDRIEDVRNASPTAIPAEEAPSNSLLEEWRLRSFSCYYTSLRPKEAFKSLVGPFSLLKTPQILVTALIFGLTIGCTIIISILTSMIYAQPPLLWGSRPIGLLNIAALIGLLIGLPVGGFLADVLFVHSARKGEPNPASRLPAMLLGGLISPAGCLAVGYGLRNPGTWIVVCTGWCMVCFGLTGSANVLLAYSINSFPSKAEYVGVVVNMAKNTIAFGLGYGAIDWMNSMGSVDQFIMMAAFLWVAYILVIPIWAYDSGRMKNGLFSRPNHV